ncbi:thiamine-phosphate kinase [Aliagarivorans taiwanensis]|uniref:thiamine-phosphate kinase n=1 Tax=Aliagarivorans taiwanensis TaxID=561966 RepID=UPI0003FD25F4|nr:thiamine-phosphate kinase [Aliagarivorans taiwanensis]
MSSVPLDEFSLIERFFTREEQRADIALGIGDDAALLTPPDNHHLVVSTDTLVEGIHFLPDIPAHALGHKSLAVNLSDLAAMGAEPRWVTLALTLPEVDEQWLSEFSRGFFELAEFYNVSLVGGDTTRGPLSITVTVHGVVPLGKALTRHGAAAGDGIYVTGTLGDSALGLAALQQRLSLSESARDQLIERHYYPQPRVLASYGLRDVASATIDISDGLLGDLGHILKRSNCSANLELERLPLSDLMRELVSEEQAIHFALTGGEDYELCFTVPEANRGQIETALSFSGVPYHCIGTVGVGSGEVNLQLNNKRYQLETSSWNHFES